MGKHNIVQRKAYKKRRKAHKAVERKAKKATETNNEILDGETDHSSVVTECSNSSCYCRRTDIKTLESYQSPCYRRAVRVKKKLNEAKYIKRSKMTGYI